MLEYEARRALAKKVREFRAWANTGASPMTFAAVGAASIQWAEALADAADALFEARRHHKGNCPAHPEIATCICGDEP